VIFAIMAYLTENNMSNVVINSSDRIDNVSYSYNTVWVGVNEEYLRIQAWLSPLKPQRKHADVQSSRLDGVGDWALQRGEFRTWYKGQDGSGDPTLLCSGDQGVGKTYIR